MHVAGPLFALVPVIIRLRIVRGPAASGQRCKGGPNVRFKLAFALALIFVIGTSRPARAACGKLPQVLVLLDRSGSMKEMIGKLTKWEIALASMKTLAPFVTGKMELGLMLFPRWPVVNKCTTGQVNVTDRAQQHPRDPVAAGRGGPRQRQHPLVQHPQRRPRLPRDDQAGGRSQYVILVTDGKETCSPHYPAVATGPLLGDGVRTYVVGFGANADPISLDAAAVAGGTGNYYQANDLPQLQTVLQSITTTIANCCGNGFLDPGESCDPGIAAGLGSCPKSAADCDDGNPATVDALVGSGCDAACTHQPLAPHGDAGVGGPDDGGPGSGIADGGAGTPSGDGKTTKARRRRWRAAATASSIPARSATRPSPPVSRERVRPAVKTATHAPSGWSTTSAAPAASTTTSPPGRLPTDAVRRRPRRTPIPTVRPPAAPTGRPTASTSVSKSAAPQDSTVSRAPASKPPPTSGRPEESNPVAPAQTAGRPRTGCGLPSSWCSLSLCEKRPIKSID